MSKSKKPTVKTYQEIADRVNTCRNINTITANQVFEIASGQDQTESHPVVAMIRNECRKEGLI